MTTTNQFLVPDPLDPAIMDPRVYHSVVGPALQVAAEVAAKRGDPTLHADMPSMLALVELVTRLVDLYRQQYTDERVDPAMLDGAPTAACVMVLQEAGLEPFAIEQCLKALQAGHAQVHDNDVLTDIRPQMAMAWAHLVEDQREQAHSDLYMAAMVIVAAIENWQEKTH